VKLDFNLYQTSNFAAGNSNLDIPSVAQWEHDPPPSQVTSHLLGSPPHSSSALSSKSTYSVFWSIPIWTGLSLSNQRRNWIDVLYCPSGFWGSSSPPLGYVWCPDHSWTSRPSSRSSPRIPNQVLLLTWPQAGPSVLLSPHGPLSPWGGLSLIAASGHLYLYVQLRPLAQDSQPLAFPLFLGT
jgi:hypothetical protein